MRSRRLLAACAAAPLVLLGLALPASAATVSVPDDPGGVIHVDNRTETRAFDVTAPGSITDVSITVDFAKIDGGTCAPYDPGPGTPYFSEVGLRLLAPDQTGVLLIQSVDPSTFNDANSTFAHGSGGLSRRVTMTFSDGESTLPRIPETGIFDPVGDLADFTGRPAVGTWTLEVQDSVGQDPLCYFGATLNIETSEHPPVAANSSESTPFETSLDFTLEATDADDNPLTYTVDEVIGGISGTVDCEPAGGPDCSYTPPDGVSGEATVDFTVTDGVDTDTGRVTITVEPEAPYVATLELEASALEVDEGDSVTITAEGIDQYGAPLGDVTEDVVFTSDVESDEIEGNAITFPTASPHTITATHVDGATADIVIEVIPADDDSGATPDDGTGSGGGGTTGSSAGPNASGLPSAGAQVGPWALIAALAMIGLGGATFWFRQRLTVGR